jgi:tRNA G10  N-methylase Trm11
MLGECHLLHLCCGRCAIEGAVNVDLKDLPEVGVRADAEVLPFQDSAFDAVLIDPPYSEEDASRYKVPRLLRPTRVLAESRRVLIEGGWMLWLDEKFPSYRRKDWNMKGLIGVATGMERRMRVLAMWQARSNGQHQGRLF